jgi:hypothetical protein
LIAALFVASDGPYFNLPGVDPWDQVRDARKYAGPHPVVAHPPCERWGRYWSGGPSAKVRRKKGDDGGCFAAALAAVRKWGGVIEHPAHSAAWETFGLMAPPMSGGWISAGDFKGLDVPRRAGPLRAPSAEGDLVVCRLETPTHLEVGPELRRSLRRRLPYKRSARARARCRYRADQANLDSRADSHAASLSRSARSYRRAKERGMTPNEFLSRRQRMLTPVPFRDELIEIARGAA